jgi:hypothetical protein
MIITCFSMLKLLIVLRTAFRYSRWGEMSQIQLDTLDLNKSKKAPVFMGGGNDEQSKKARNRMQFND